MRTQKKGVALTFFILPVLLRAEAEILPGVLLIGEVAKWSEDFGNYVETGYQTISTLRKNFGDTCYNEGTYTNAVTGRVIQVIPKISTQLAGISVFLESRDTNFEGMVNQLKLEISINERISALSDKMGAIDGLYEELSERISTEKRIGFDGRSYCFFARNQIYEHPLTRKINAMYNIVVPSQQLRATSWLADIRKDLELHNETLCDTGHSVLDTLHSIYTSLIVVEMKAYAITAFSHNLLFNFNGTGFDCRYDKNPNDAIFRAQKKLYKHMRKYNFLFLKIMEGVSREFRACDRGDYKRDETFFELEGTIQSIILVRRPEYMDECTDFHKATSAAFCNSKSKFCMTPAVRNCLGYLRDCYHSPDPFVEGCKAVKSSPRRYEFFNDLVSVSRRELDTTKCPKDRDMIMQEPCYCECIDNAVNSQSTHLFNLQWVESDVSENMVITGIRFIVKYGIMQFQIQQGRLGFNFRVEEPKWKPVNDISEEIRAARLNKKLRGESPGVVENEDYFVAADNGINFDTLNVSYPNVLTGVRFSILPGNTSGDARIQIEIKGTKFNHTAQELCKNCEPEIVKSTISHENLYTYDVKNVGQPIFPTKPASATGQYTVISRSDILSDFGQTTLPFFDALPLVSSPPAPLGGLGIFHKTSGTFTGFLSLKFVSLDYVTYMKMSANEYKKQKGPLAIAVKGENAPHYRMYRRYH